MVHNEVHKAQKPREALPSQVVAKVTKGQRAHSVFRPDHKGQIIVQCSPVSL